MAYLGRQPVLGNFVKLDAITAVNGQAAYTMQNGSANFTDYSTVNQFLISLNGTIQSPGSSFTVSGSTLTFASNLSTGDVIDFIIVFGNSLSAGTPTDATVTTAKLADDSVTAAKINNDIISGSTELATAPADTDEFLVSDAGTLKRVDYSHIKGGGITEADFFFLPSEITSNGTITSLTRATTGFDKIGTGMTQSSGTFTFPSTGLYEIRFQGEMDSTDGDSFFSIGIYATTDGSGFNEFARARGGRTDSNGDIRLTTSCSILFDVTDTSTHKVRMNVDSLASGTLVGASAPNYRTCVIFKKLGDT